MNALFRISAPLLLLLGSMISYADEGMLLKGDWLDQSCHISHEEAALSAQTSLKFQGNQVMVVNRYYESDDCTGEATFAVDYQGSYEMGESIVLENGETAIQYTITIPQSVVEAAHLGKETTLSNINRCEIHSWTFGDTRDVFTCVFAPSHSNVIQEVAMTNGKTLLKGMLVKKA